MFFSLKKYFLILFSVVTLGIISIIFANSIFQRSDGVKQILNSGNRLEKNKMHASDDAVNKAKIWIRYF